MSGWHWSFYLSTDKVQIKIYYYHTDSGGVVYYGRYLEFLEQARTEFFAEKGYSIKELAQQGILFVVSRQEIDYKAPAFYGDTLNIHTVLSKIARVSLEFTHEIKNQDNQPVSTAKTTLACVEGKFKPRAIPEEMRKKIG